MEPTEVTFKWNTEAKLKGQHENTIWFLTKWNYTHTYTHLHVDELNHSVKKTARQVFMKYGRNADKNISKQNIIFLKGVRSENLQSIY